MCEGEPPHAFGRQYSGGEERLDSTQYAKGRYTVRKILLYIVNRQQILLLEMYNFTKKHNKRSHI